MFLFGGTMTVFVVIALISAIAATVLAFIFIAPEKKAAKLNKFCKLLHDIVNFKSLIIEKIMQALYILSTAFVIVLGFLMLFYVEGGGYYSSPRWYGGKGILLMIIGPIVIRIIYELLMMFILLVKNVISINNKMNNPDGNGGNADPFVSGGFDDIKNAFRPEQQYSAPAYEQPMQEQTGSAFCPNCGSQVVGGGFCPVCGTKL